MAKMRFYFDGMLARLVANELTKMGYEVVMAVDVEIMEKEDSQHLHYATEHNLVLVALDRPFAGVTSKHTDHSGLVCWIENQSDFSGQIRALSAFAAQHTPEEVAGHVVWLK